MCIKPPAAPVNHPTRGAAGVEWRQRQDGVVTAASTRALPPGPMDGGFLPEVDPIQRLIQLQVPLAATVTDGNVIGSWEGLDGTVALPCCGSAPALPQATSASTSRYNDEGCDDDLDLDVPSDVELALIAVKCVRVYSVPTRTILVSSVCNYRCTQMIASRERPPP